MDGYGFGQLLGNVRFLYDRYSNKESKSSDVMASEDDEIYFNPGQIIDMVASLADGRPGNELSLLA